MANKQINRIRTISEFHKGRGLSKPEHPLISLVDYREVRHSPENNRIIWIQDFCTIGLKRNVCGKFRYGQQGYDFDEGLMSFIASGQVFSIEGTLSSGQAAELAGLSKRSFIEMLGKYGVSVFSTSVEDLESDIANA
jgi:hypothetical protein